MLDFIKNIFYDDKKGIKILPIALGVAGAFLLPMIPAVAGMGIAGNLIGAAVGLAIGSIADNAMNGGAESSAPPHGAGAKKPPAGGPQPRVETPDVPNMNAGRANGK